MGSEDIKKNVEATRKATKSSRYQKDGLTSESVNLSSKNFDKLMQNRKLSKEDIVSLKASFKKFESLQKQGFSSKKISAQKTSTDNGSEITARHAKKGEQVVITHGQENASGNFVTKESAGKTPDERIDNLALYPTNPADFETKAALDKDQVVIEGKISAQSKFQKLDDKGRPRSGGGTQIVTDGGYKSGALRNEDPKFPVVSDKKQDRAESFKKSLSVEKKADKSYVKSNGNKHGLKR